VIKYSWSHLEGTLVLAGLCSRKQTKHGWVDYPAVVRWLPEGTRPGNLLQFAIENGPIEIVDLPIKIVIFHSYVSLPEGSLRVLTRHRFVFDGQMIFGRGHTGDWANRNAVLTKHMRIFTKQNWSSNGLHFWIPQEQWVWPREKKHRCSAPTHTHITMDQRMAFSRIGMRIS